MKLLEGKIILITGAGSGIGRALAIQGAGMGAVLALADIDEEKLKETGSLIDSDKSQFRLFPCDIGSPEDLQHLYQSVTSAFGKVDVLINNAGFTIRRQKFHEIDPESFRKMMDVNVFGAIELTRLCLPAMIERGSGHIANVSSIYAMLGVGQRIAYCTAKFALRGFTETLRQELRQSGIGVTSVLPGGVKTNITRNSRGWPSKEQQESAARVTEKAAISSPEKAARLIYRGIKRNKARVLIGIDAWALDRLARWFPATYHAAVDAILSKVEKRMIAKQQAKSKNV